MAFLLITLINDNTIQKLLNTRSNIKESILRVFLSSHFLRKKRKELKTLTTSFLIFEVRHVNSRKTFESSSIRPSKEIIVSISSLNFKLMDMENFKTSLDNK
jgi:uncharacterized protein (DUF488 family)